MDFVLRYSLLSYLYYFFSLNIVFGFKVDKVHTSRDFTTRTINAIPDRLIKTGLMHTIGQMTYQTTSRIINTQLDLARLSNLIGNTHRTRKRIRRYCAKLGT